MESYTFINTKTMSKSVQQTKLQPVEPVDPLTKAVIVQVSFAPITYDRMVKFRKAKGMLSDQEAVRLAVVDSLDRMGY